ncbi:MAG: DUF2723 domain-containing protein [Porphyromonas sp.]|nr:DUF2723 domain-containing protein [Porphyromonas sp.]
MDQQLEIKRYKRWERLGGWLIFLFSTIVYLLTMEKSSGLWDNPEFITTFHKLEVGHPPGAPFYMLVYNFFSHFFPQHGDWIAIAANTASGIISGITVMILFRTIAHLIRRGDMLYKSEGSVWEVQRVIPKDRAVLYLGGALVGSFLYAFTDTFWYNAVEAEVYSFSSCFTALVFYLMLKWEEQADEEGVDRWLLLIAYLMGLSVGVHLLNLLAIPAMALIYYFRKYEEQTLKGALLAILISFGIIAILMFGILQGVPQVAGWFDLLFVNTLGLPYNTGLAFYVVVLLLLLGGTIYLAISRPVRVGALQISFLLSVVLIGIPFMGNGWVLPTLIITGLTLYLFKAKSLDLHVLGLSAASMLLFFVGLSTYGVTLIRANSDIPMNQNTPSDVFSLRYYLSREQYGNTPLIYGQTYASLPKYDEYGKAVTKKSTTYKRVAKTTPEEKDRYVKVTSESIQYRDDMKMFFPRVYSAMMPHHKQGYEIWGNVEGRSVTVNDRGEMRTVVLPTFGENLRYFFTYQVNYMYWRYFLWNFSGRQNDLHGQGELTKGNAITGIPFIDALFLGSQDNLPSDITNNKGHNRYFMLPLILGVIGLIGQIYGSRRNRQNFWVILMLFFMTGLAIVLYLNQPPFQVRERDYAYAGSFYAFAIWIGFAVPVLYDLIARRKEAWRKPIVALIVTLICLPVPVLVLAENYDDHNRHGRRLTIDTGNNYLESCEPGSIIFCNGDNDTFPLWYAQEVEGVRTDVKVANTSYLQADWYIEQMKRPTYDAQPLPITWGMKEYGGDKRSVVYIVPQIKDTIPARVALDFAASDDPALRKLPQVAQLIDYIPGEFFSVKYDTQELIERGILYPSDTALVQNNEQMVFDFSSKSYLGKQELAIMDMLENSKFERPVYYCITVADTEHLKMTDNFRQTGMVYQVLPFNVKGTGTEIDTERMYRNVTERFKWGGADVEGVYFDENSRNMLEAYRSKIFAPLASSLLAEGDTVRAKEILALAETAIRPDVVPHSVTSIPLIGAHYDAGDIAGAEKTSRTIMEKNLEYLRWYFSLNPKLLLSSLRDLESHLIVCSELLRYNKAYDGKLGEVYEEEVDQFSRLHYAIYRELEKSIKQ